MKVWDITPATDGWERHYAWMEYTRIGWFNLWGFAKPIEVHYG